jgi:hypothetical protein
MQAGRSRVTPVICDDEGQVVPADAPDLARRLRCAAVADVTGHAVRDLGFIHIVPRRGALIIKFVPALVHPLAAIAAFYAIASEAPERVVLIHYAEDERIEIFVNIAAGIRRIETLLAAARNPIGQSLFQARPLPAGALAAVAGGRFVPLLETWRAQGGRWDMAHYRLLQHLGLIDSTLVTRSQAGSQRVLKEFRGGFEACKAAREWPIGHDLEDQPDRRFGQWVAATYRGVVAAREPRIEAVDVALAASGRNTSIRFRYDRIVLPWQAQNGDRIAVGALFMHHPPPA